MRYAGENCNPVSHTLQSLCTLIFHLLIKMLIVPESYIQGKDKVLECFYFIQNDNITHISVFDDFHWNFHSQRISRVFHYIKTLALIEHANTTRE